MGNCLDIPPPPSKRRTGMSSSEPYYYLNSRASSAASLASAQSAQNAFNAYQPYAALSGSRPMVAMDPITGETITYETVGMINAAQPYYVDPLLHGGFSYYGEETQRTSQTKKRHHKGRERRYQNGGVHTNNRTKSTNLNSTLITTFPDPSDDIIKRGHEIIVSNHSAKIHNGIISTSSIASEDRGIQTQNFTLSAPKATKGSTFVTYIEEESPPSQTEEEITVEEATEEVVEETTETETKELVVGGGFKETGEADEGIVQLYIDDPVPKNKTAAQTSTSSMFVTSSSLKQIGLMQLSARRVPRDVVICYSPADTEVMIKIKRELESAGLTVAVSNANVDITNEDFTDFLMFPQEIIDAKMMVVLLSQESVRSRQQLDEVSLAHVTDTCIFPVAVGNVLEILGAMEVDLKLQLASYKWTELSGEIHADVSIDFLIRSMQEELEAIRGYEIIDEDYGEVSSWAQRRQKIIRRHQVKRFISFGSHTTAAQYWDKYYASGEMSVPWDRFFKDLRAEYRGALSSSVPKSCTPPLIDSLKRELRVDSDGLVHKDVFIDFCSDLGSDEDVWERVRSVAKEAQAIRNVLDKESTVRLVAIENIGKFGTPSVLSGLRELLVDQDPQIRAVATMSLSRCVLPGDTVTLNSMLATLDDKDKLVRETGCLAMGHMRVRQAVDRLAHLGTNDPVPTVREAAAVALNQIEGEQMEDLMQY